MKRLYLAVLLVIAVSILPVAAQNISEEKASEYYYVNTTIEKIYPYRRGYVVQYRKNLTSIGRVYLPVEWFTDAAGKGELIWLNPGRAWPSLSIYYKGGEFSHVRLHVRRELTHESWGNIPQNINIDSYFENVTEIKLEY